MFAAISLVLFLFSGSGSGSVCKFDDEIYKDGETFITKDCNSKCICHSNEKGQGYSCVPLCGPVDVECGFEEIIELRSVKSVGNCTCIEPVCERHPYVCNFDDEIYKDGETFITKDCNSQCKCHSNENGQGHTCVPLCGLINVECGFDEIEELRSVNSVGNCTCTEPVCVPHPDGREAKYKKNSQDDSQIDMQLSDSTVVKEFSLIEKLEISTSAENQPRKA